MSERVNEYGLTSHLTQYRSFQRRPFQVKCTYMIKLVTWVLMHISCIVVTFLLLL